MSVLTDTKVAKLEEQMKQVQFQVSQIMAAINAMTEANNAVVEGDDTERATSNGKIKKAHR